MNPTSSSAVHLQLLFSAVSSNMGLAAVKGKQSPFQKATQYVQPSNSPLCIPNNCTQAVREDALATAEQSLCVVAFSSCIGGGNAALCRSF